jgi:sugar lactone lactonase YvrE
LTVDHDGGVWVALSNGAAVRSYDRTGRFDQAIELPVPELTACTIGGAGMDTLFITTSHEGLAPGAFSVAGSLFSRDR